MLTAALAPSFLHQNLNILHLEDSELDHQLVCRALTKEKLPYTITRVDSLEDFEEQIRVQALDIILADYRLPGFTALEAWGVLQRTKTRLPFVLLSGQLANRQR